MVERLFPRIEIEMVDGVRHIVQVSESFLKFMMRFEEENFLVLDCSFCNAASKDCKLLAINRDHVIRVKELNDD